jgi:hypothetical protein
LELDLQALKTTVHDVIERSEGYNVTWEDDNGTPHTQYCPAEAMELASVQRERKQLEDERESQLLSSHG